MDRFPMTFAFAGLLAGCAATGVGNGMSPLAAGATSPPVSGTSAIASTMADRAANQEVNYVNVARQGSQVVVLPGEIKSNHAIGFGPNNIADMAEIELTRANFKVFERANLAELDREFQLAYTKGNPQVARDVLQKGKLRATRWVVRFDILKAEPVAKASRGLSGAAIADVLNSIGGKAGSVGSGLAQSAQFDETSAVWLVGMRYKIIDANTTDQVATGYVEDKMEVGGSASSFGGVTRSVSAGTGLDTLVQRLVQKSVAEIDARHK